MFTHIMDAIKIVKSPKYVMYSKRITVLYRYMQAMQKTLHDTVAKATFGDENDMSSCAADAVKAMQRAGIINGKPGNIFDPLGNATRAEVAAMIHRFALAVK